MLVLGLEVEDRVVIGDPAAPIGYIKLTKVKGDRAWLGFEFTGNVEVNRESVAKRIVEAKK